MESSDNWMRVLTLNFTMSINERADLPRVMEDPWSSRWINAGSRFSIRMNHNNPYIPPWSTCWPYWLQLVGFVNPTPPMMCRWIHSNSTINIGSIWWSWLIEPSDYHPGRFVQHSSTLWRVVHTPPGCCRPAPNWPELLHNWSWGYHSWCWGTRWWVLGRLPEWRTCTPSWCSTMRYSRWSWRHKIWLTNE